MSHKATVQTKITDLDSLKKTIKDLGYSYYEGQDLSGSYTRDWSEEDRKADLVIDIKGRKDLGFKKNSDGFYNLVGDFYGLAGGQKGLADSVAQRYAVNKIQKEVNASSTYGILGLTETIQADGSITLEGEIDESQIVSA